MAVSGNFKTLLIRQLFDQATALGLDDAGNGQFYAVIKAAAFAQATQTSSGLLITGTTGNGKSVSFSVPPNQAGLTPVAITEFYAELLNRWDDALATLGYTAPAPPGTDAQIFTQLLAFFRPIKGYTKNFMYLAK